MNRTVYTGPPSALQPRGVPVAFSDRSDGPSLRAYPGGRPLHQRRPGGRGRPARGPGRPAAPGRSAAPTSGGGAPPGRARRRRRRLTSSTSASRVRGPKRTVRTRPAAGLERPAALEQGPGGVGREQLDHQVQVGPLAGRAADRLGLVERRHGHQVAVVRPSSATARRRWARRSPRLEPRPRKARTGTGGAPPALTRRPGTGRAGAPPARPPRRRRGRRAAGACARSRPLRTHPGVGVEQDAAPPRRPGPRGGRSVAPVTTVAARSIRAP